MKYNNKMNRNLKMILPVTFVVAAVLCSCNRDFTQNPEAVLGIFTKNAKDSLISVDSIFAKKTNLFFMNSGQAFFSVVYPGNKELKDSLVGTNGKDSLIWTINYDFNDREKAGYYDKTGKRAVKGIALEYQGNINAFINTKAFVFPKAGTYTIYLEAINPDETGTGETSTDSRTITVY
jgi:hypothetical protein